MKNLLPLRQRNPLAVPYKPLKEKTKLCDFAKAKSMCRKGGCSFAHSLDELVLSCGAFSSLEEKKAFVEATTGKKVADHYLRPSYKNSSDRLREHKELKFVMMMRAEENEENEEKYEDSEDEDEQESCVTDSDDRDTEIEEVLQEIEMMEHQEEFVEETDTMEMEEFDESIIVDTFYYNPNGEKL